MKSKAAKQSKHINVLCEKRQKIFTIKYFKAARCLTGRDRNIPNKKMHQNPPDLEGTAPYWQQMLQGVWDEHFV